MPVHMEGAVVPVFAWIAKVSHKKRAGGDQRHGVHGQAGQAQRRLHFDFGVICHWICLLLLSRSVLVILVATSWVL